MEDKIVIMKESIIKKLGEELDKLIESAFNSLGPSCDTPTLEDIFVKEGVQYLILREAVFVLEEYTFAESVYKFLDSVDNPAGVIIERYHKIIDSNKCSMLSILESFND